MPNDQHTSYHSAVPTTSRHSVNDIPNSVALRSPLALAYDAACEAASDAWDTYQQAQSAYEAQLAALLTLAPLDHENWIAYTADLAQLRHTLNAAEAIWSERNREEHRLHCQLMAWFAAQDRC